MKLVLTVSRWRQRDGKDSVIHKAGDEIDVDETTGAWLVKSGAAVDPADVAPVVETVVVPEAEPVAEAIDSVVEEPKKPEVARPLNAAKRELWEAYAASLGISTKGMKTKDEIIAAVG